MVDNIMDNDILVNSLAVITAQNPFGSKLSYNINYDLNRKLRIELQEYNHPAMQMEGHYAGTQENSFLVVNIPRARLMELAQKYRQKAAVWAFMREMDETYLHFQYIENGKISGNRIVPVCKSYLESADELFYAIRTGGFTLPVLDKEPEETKEDQQEVSYDEL